MDKRELRAREIQDAIRQILLHDWDPIGVQDVPQAQDEYDSYIGSVYRLLATGATDDQVAAHLFGLEGLVNPTTDSPARLLPVARKLRALNVKVEER